MANEKREVLLFYFYTEESYEISRHDLTMTHVLFLIETTSKIRMVYIDQNNQQNKNNGLSVPHVTLVQLFAITFTNVPGFAITFTNVPGFAITFTHVPGFAIIIELVGICLNHFDAIMSLIPLRLFQNVLIATL